MNNFSYIPIIVTFNRKNDLTKAIKSVLNQTIKPKKIIVIDNHSSDGTRELIEKKYSNEMINNMVEYHYLSENLGGSGGFNKGVEYAMQYDVDYIALSDDDGFYQKNYFEEIYKVVVKNPSIKAFQGFSYDDIQNKYFVQGCKIVNRDTLNVLPITDITHSAIADISTFVGLTISTQVIKKIGLPVDNFFIWNDDAEYSLRMSPYTKIMQVRNAVIEHRGTQRENGALVPLWKTYYGFRNKIILRKRYSKNKTIAYVYTTYLLLRQYLAILIKKSYHGQRTKYFKAFTDAFFDGLGNKLGKNSKYSP